MLTLYELNEHKRTSMFFFFFSFAKLEINTIISSEMSQIDQIQKCKKKIQIQKCKINFLNNINQNKVLHEKAGYLAQRVLHNHGTVFWCLGALTQLTQFTLCVRIKNNKYHVCNDQGYVSLLGWCDNTVDNIELYSIDGIIFLISREERIYTFFNKILIVWVIGELPALSAAIAVESK